MRNMTERVLGVALLATLICALPAAAAQGVSRDDALYQTALTDLEGFARSVTEGRAGSRAKAQAIVTWFAGNFDWTATDYKKRTVQEILERKGGNCNELAKVAIASMEAIGLKMRRIREINLHVESDSRQRSAAGKIAESGPRMSVFGKNHNDHVWIEILDDASGEWFPADPSLGVVGEKEWLAARLGFGERFTLDPTSKDMIAPFAVYAMVDGGFESRTVHYVIDGFDGLYAGGLKELPSWAEWRRLVVLLDEKAREAFAGETDLHQYSNEIASLVATYASIRKEFEARSEKGSQAN